MGRMAMGVLRMADRMGDLRRRAGPTVVTMAAHPRVRRLRAADQAVVLKALQTLHRNTDNLNIGSEDGVPTSFH